MRAAPSLAQPRPARPVSASLAQPHAGEVGVPGAHDAVVVLRNGPKLDDPIIHVKNVYGDRGRHFIEASNLVKPATARW